MVFTIMCEEMQWCFGKKWLWIEKDVNTINSRLGMSKI
jgi:hypothetical protein